jgi:hypothetical protein
MRYYNGYPTSFGLGENVTPGVRACMIQKAAQLQVRFPNQKLNSTMLYYECMALEALIAKNLGHKSFGATVPVFNPEPVPTMGPVGVAVPTNAAPSMSVAKYPDLIITPQAKSKPLPITLFGGSADSGQSATDQGTAPGFLSTLSVPAALGIGAAGGLLIGFILGKL